MSGDQVTCVAVLKLAKEPGANDSLFIAVEPDWKLRILPCRLKGEKRRRSDGGPEWEYKVIRPDFNLPGELEVDPSVLCSDTEFHTGNPWRCKYVTAKGAAYKRFYKENPTIAE